MNQPIEMAKLALQLIDVHKNFGVTPIIRGLNLEVRQGERHAVIGPNGAGKSRRAARLICSRIASVRSRASRSFSTRCQNE